METLETLFRYNWQARKDWFDWCKTVPSEELLKRRVGGVGSILKTLFHIVDVEYSWLSALQGNPDFEEPFESYQSLELVITLSEKFHSEVEAFVIRWSPDMEQQILTVPYKDGQMRSYRFGEIMRHVIAHEIHHIGQISVWSREIGREPVTANLIRRGLYEGM